MKDRDSENLKDATIAALARHGKTPADVRWVGGKQAQYHWEPQSAYPNGWRISWDDFARLADRIYDSGFGGQEVYGGLLVVGDDWWIEREEYDGSEWWAFKTQPSMPETLVEDPAPNLIWKY